MATDVRHPVGRLEVEPAPTPEQRLAWIQELEEAPAALRAAVAGLNDAQLDTPYRDGGWTVRQLVHHVPDSHMHGYIRFKLALTEDAPVIAPYDQALWATLADTRTVPVEASLRLLESLHARWVALLHSMQPADFCCTYTHPEDGPVTLDRALQIYAFHGRHHTAHITGLRQRQGWV
jgi:uncharacterized damage-inducible protein DinB